MLNLKNCPNIFGQDCSYSFVRLYLFVYQFYIIKTLKLHFLRVYLFAYSLFSSYFA